MNKVKVIPTYTNKKSLCIVNNVDKPYSFQYFSLIENIQNIELSIKVVENLYDRTNLDEEFDELQAANVLHPIIIK